MAAPVSLAQPFSDQNQMRNRGLHFGRREEYGRCEATLGTAVRWSAASISIVHNHEYREQSVVICLTIPIKYNAKCHRSPFSFSQYQGEQSRYLYPVLYDHKKAI